MSNLEDFTKTFKRGIPTERIEETLFLEILMRHIRKVQGSATCYYNIYVPGTREPLLVSRTIIIQADRDDLIRYLRDSLANANRYYLFTHEVDTWLASIYKKANCLPTPFLWEQDSVVFALQYTKDNLKLVEDTISEALLAFEI